MEPSKLTRAVLGASGLAALAIGGSILVAPHTFYASYGIDLGDRTNLLNELRAIGGGLAAMALVILSGAAWSRHAPMAIIVACALYLSYGASRLWASLVDGLPDTGLIAAAGLELTIGAACVGVLVRDIRRGRRVAMPFSATSGRQSPATANH